MRVSHRCARAVGVCERPRDRENSAHSGTVLRFSWLLLEASVEDSEPCWRCGMAPRSHRGALREDNTGSYHNSHLYSVLLRALLVDPELPQQPHPRQLLHRSALVRPGSLRAQLLHRLDQRVYVRQSCPLEPQSITPLLYLCQVFTIMADTEGNAAAEMGKR